MLEGYIQKISVNFQQERNKLIAFLEKHHLRYESDIETAFGVFDYSGELLGCGCCARNLLKCFAVDEKLRGQNALGSLISYLTEERFSKGYYYLFVVTRPHNKALFSACGFYPLAETESLVMLENTRYGLKRFYEKFCIPGVSKNENRMNGTRIGCIVANCNPFTKGHLALISYATSRCEQLYVFVVEEDCSDFPFPVRFRLVQEGCAQFPNVRVCPSGPYIISSATFPTYFLKTGEDAVRLQSVLDITLFAERIAPMFGISVRFAGEEPLDPTTRRYNQTMKELLPQYNISFEEVKRKCVPGSAETQDVITASLVRKLLRRDGVTEEVLNLVPPCTAKYLKSEFKGFSANEL